MIFSEFFNVSVDGNDYWFDPILHQDTRLFIDPFLIFKKEEGYFDGVYSDIMCFFNLIFKLIAQSGGNKNSLIYKKAENLLTFREVDEICLGYSPSRDGAGPAKGWARIIANNINECIKRDIFGLRHFEEIGLFSAGIGPDAISDITANLIKLRLIAYTQDICRQKNIPMSNILLRNASLDWEHLRWEHKEVMLPINANKRNSGILLVPRFYLDRLPEINIEDFWDTVVDNEILRSDLNYEIDKNLTKAKIAKIAINNYNIVDSYINIVENRDASPYDLDKDNLLRYKWYTLAREIKSEYPLHIDQPTNEESFYQTVINISLYFKNFIENNSGYKLLWDNNYVKSKSEEAVQLLFFGIVEQHCKANNIDLSKEVNQGRGPVDFKFSNGYRNKVLLEAKLANNTKFWSGVEKQLPLYLKSNTTKNGIFLVIAYRKKDFDKINNIYSIIHEINKNQNLNINVIVVDATANKPSASKL